MGGYIEFLLARSGRVSRKDFWLKYVLPLIGVGIVTSIIDVMVSGSSSSSSGPVSNIVNLVLLWPQIVVTAKRFHDRNMTGWWQIVFNVAIAGGGALAFVYAGNGGSQLMIITGAVVAGVAAIIELVILGFLPGTKGSNKYGDDPLHPTAKLAETFA